MIVGHPRRMHDCEHPLHCTRACGAMPAARLPVALAGSFAFRSPLGEVSGPALPVCGIDCKHPCTYSRACSCCVSRRIGIPRVAVRPSAGRPPQRARRSFCPGGRSDRARPRRIWYWHQSRRLLAGDAKRVLGPEKQVARFRRSCTSQPCSEESRPDQSGLRRKPTDRHGQRTASVQVKRTGDRTQERQVATR